MEWFGKSWPQILLLLIGIIITFLLNTFVKPPIDEWLMKRRKEKRGAIVRDKRDKAKLEASYIRAMQLKFKAEQGEYFLEVASDMMGIVDGLKTMVISLAVILAIYPFLSLLPFVLYGVVIAEAGFILSRIPLLKEKIDIVRFSHLYKSKIETLQRFR